MIQDYSKSLCTPLAFLTARSRPIQQSRNSNRNLPSRRFFHNNEFQRRFCLLDGGACAKPISVIRYFDGTYANVSARFHDPEFKDRISVLNAANTNHETQSYFRYHMGKYAVVSQYNAVSKITRLSLSIGKPLKVRAPSSSLTPFHWNKEL